MEANTADATVEQAHKKELASDVGSSANDSAPAVSAGAETTSADLKIEPTTEKDNNLVRTPTSDTAPSVDSLEAGLVAVGITPSPSPPPAHQHVPSASSSSGFPRSDYVPPLPGTGMDHTNVFIKYLPTDLTNTGLYTLFSQFGEITSCKVMVDPITGYSLGYGFVRFSTAEEAANAIINMYGQTIGNKTLLCKLSHGIPQNNATPSDNLYIKPLLDTTTEEHLLSLFSPFGRVLECKVMLDKNTGQSRQIGFVRFATIEEATKALAANNGRYLTDDAPPMVVKYAESRSQKITRRAKLLANQVAAESRRNAAQLKQQQHADMLASEAAGDALVLDAEVSQGSPSSPVAAAASIPYIVKDEYGNVTFAPEPEQVESAAAAASTASQSSAPSGNYWHGRSNGHYEGGRGGSRRGGRGGGHRARTPYPSYHPSDVDSGAAGDDSEQHTPAPHHGHAAVYRKKGHAANSEQSSSNNASSTSNHHSHSHAPHYRPSSGRASLPTFHNSSTPRVQLAGKVEVGKNGELSAPEWADDPTRLFISHLPLDYEPSALQALFEVHGSVTSAKISQDKRSARPKTYGFVQFSTPEAAAKAVKEMHGTIVDGRPINVAFEATQSVAKHRNENPYYYYQHPAPYEPTGHRGGRGGGRGRPRVPLPYGPAYYYPDTGEAAPPPYMYMVDPSTGMPYPYPVYFPSMPMAYVPESVSPPESYYPSNNAPAPASSPATRETAEASS